MEIPKRLMNDTRWRRLTPPKNMVIELRMADGDIIRHAAYNDEGYWMGNQLLGRAQVTKVRQWRLAPLHTFHYPGDDPGTWPPQTTPYGHCANGQVMSSNCDVANMTADEFLCIGHRMETGGVLLYEYCLRTPAFTGTVVWAEEGTFILRWGNGQLVAVARQFVGDSRQKRTAYEEGSENYCRPFQHATHGTIS